MRAFERRSIREAGGWKSFEPTSLLTNLPLPLPMQTPLMRHQLGDTACTQSGSECNHIFERDLDPEYAKLVALLPIDCTLSAQRL